MAITLLNIDRVSDRDSEQIENEIYEQIDNLYSLLDQFGDGKIPKPRLTILRNRARDLQDTIADFGETTQIDMFRKQSIIFELHPQLLALSNALIGLDKEVDLTIQGCISYLLNLLCSSAAANPKSVVIGVSNILAQVLSEDIGLDELPEIDKDEEDPGYFNSFVAYYNYLLTSAGLYAATVTGLPGISISALGSWTEKALKQFGLLRKFIEQNYNPVLFYNIDGKYHSSKDYDTTKDIINSYLYENEILIQMATRTDIISGIEFPEGFTLSNNVETFRGGELTDFFCDKIYDNCSKIEEIIFQLYEMYDKGTVNRNQNPRADDEFTYIMLQVKGWKTIAEFGKILVNILNDEPIDVLVELSNTITNLSPPKNKQARALYHHLSNLVNVLTEIQNISALDLDGFLKSSFFPIYRMYFRFVIYVVAIHDLTYLNNDWLKWLMDEYSVFFTEMHVEFTSIETLIIAQLKIFLGVATENSNEMKHGLMLLDLVEPYIEFQTHHIAAIRLLRMIVNAHLEGIPLKERHDKLADYIMKFIEEYEIPVENMLFHKLNTLINMITIYFDKDDDERIQRQHERKVPFDIFTWLTLPVKFSETFLWIALNTSVENLNMG